ncbi:hypothetical protein Pelo_16449 [Pelomyxa schiedti]|nr:hypothetical protein Pelo_16449 [Pelomyxa schiedti]
MWGSDRGKMPPADDDFFGAYAAEFTEPHNDAPVTQSVLEAPPTNAMTSAASPKATAKAGPVPKRRRLVKSGATANNNNNKTSTPKTNHLTCVICQDTLDSNTESTTTSSNSASNILNMPEFISIIQPCGHQYHRTCIVKWSETANTCPLCKSVFNKVVINEKGEFLLVKEKVQQCVDLDPAFIVVSSDEESESEEDYIEESAEEAPEWYSSEDETPSYEEFDLVERYEHRKGISAYNLRGPKKAQEEEPDHCESINIEFSDSEEEADKEETSWWEVDGKFVVPDGHLSSSEEETDDYSEDSAAESDSSTSSRHNDRKCHPPRFKRLVRGSNCNPIQSTNTEDISKPAQLTNEVPSSQTHAKHEQEDACNTVQETALLPDTQYNTSVAVSIQEPELLHSDSNISTQGELHDEEIQASASSSMQSCAAEVPDDREPEHAPPSCEAKPEQKKKRRRNHKKPRYSTTSPTPVSDTTVPQTPAAMEEPPIPLAPTPTPSPTYITFHRPIHRKVPSSPRKQTNPHRQQQKQLHKHPAASPSQRKRKSTTTQQQPPQEHQQSSPHHITISKQCHPVVVSLADNIRRRVLLPFNTEPQTTKQPRNHQRLIFTTTPFTQRPQHHSHHHTAKRTAIHHKKDTTKRTTTTTTHRERKA